MGDAKRAGAESPSTDQKYRGVNLPHTTQIANLPVYVGGIAACQAIRGNTSPNLAVLHATKTCHARLLGYPTHAGADKSSPEYLKAVRNNGRELYLNLIDPRNPDYISVEVMRAAVAFAHMQLHEHRTVLIHCDKGESRSPAIALMLLVSLHRFHEACDSAGELIDAFQRIVYPDFHPSFAMSDWLTEHWREFIPTAPRVYTPVEEGSALQRLEDPPLFAGAD